MRCSASSRATSACGRRWCATTTSRSSRAMRAVKTALAAAVALALAAGATQAQGYPTKPVRLINGFQPGGPTDVIGRILADHLTKTMGQQFIVEAKPGAAGNL